MKQKFSIVSSSSQIVVMGNYIALMDVIENHNVYGQVIVLKVACKEKGWRFDKGEQE
jgi:hypothetical protein